MTQENNVKFTSQIGVLEYLIGMNYVLIPQSVIEKLGGKFKLRLWCSINENDAFQCGLVALGQGDGYISVNKKRMNAYKLKPGDDVLVSLSLDNSDYGMPVPAELEELFMQDPEGYRRFKLLNPGKQRYVIHYVNSVKSTELRLDRAIMLINNLKTIREGKESFRGILGLES